MKIEKYLTKTYSNLSIFFKKMYNNKTSRFFIYVIIILILTIFLTNYVIRRDLYYSIDKSKKIIYFGQTCDLENNQVSINYSKGFQLAFQHINKNGGINDYQLKIILYNDKYEPELASSNAKLLVDYFNVLALIGPFGTPTTISILNNAIEGRNIPLLFPFSAATSYRQVFNKYLILMNPTYFTEFDLMTKNILKNNIKNISIIYQDDDYGKAFYNAYNEYILKNKYNINVLSSGKYTRNTIDFDDCFRKLFKIEDVYDYNEYKKSEILPDLQGVVLFCAEKQVSILLGHLKRIKPELFIYYNFFVGTNKNNYKDLNKYNSENIYQTLLSPNIKKNYPLLYKKYIEELNLYNNDKNNKIKIEPDTQSTQMGFYNGLLIGEVLKKFEDISNIDRESFMDMFYKVKNFDIYGLKIGPFILNESNLGLKQASLNVLKNDTMVIMDELKG